MYEIPANVYTTLLGVDVAPAEGVQHWHNPYWDNDIDNGPDGPKALADKLTVTARYQAYNRADKQGEKKLTYWYNVGATARAKALAGGYQNYGPYYLFGDGTDYTSGDTSADATSTYSKGVAKWNGGAKGDVTTNVTVKHIIDPLHVAKYYDAARVAADPTGTTLPYANGILPNYRASGTSAYPGYTSEILQPYNPSAAATDAAKFIAKDTAQNKKNKVAVTWVSSNSK
jgi:hypothetical protein